MKAAQLLHNFMNKEIKGLSKNFIQQLDQCDCGAVCLLSIIKFYGGNAKLETIRNLSGTTSRGTTLLGLFQAANHVGLVAEGFKTDIEYLKTIKEPCILHVVINGNCDHYIICYPKYSKGGFGLQNTLYQYIIGDPAKGIFFIDEKELNDIWKDKALLSLKPAKHFIKSQTANYVKYRWFINILKDDYILLSISIFLGLFIAIMGLSIAIFSQKLIDNILPKSNIIKLNQGLILLFLLLIFKTILSYLRQHFLLIQSRNFNKRITGTFYECLLYLPKSFFDNRKTGDMIARMNDTMRIQRSIAYITGSFFIDSLIVILSEIFLFSYSWIIASIALLSIPFMVLIVAIFHKNILRGQQKVMAAYAKNESNYVDTIQGIDTIKEFNKEQFFTNLTRSIYTFFQDNSFTLGKVGNKFSLFTEILATILIISIITTASNLVLTKQLTLGQLVAILSIIGGLIPSVIRLALTNLQIQEAKVAFDRMYEFISVVPEYIKNDSLTMQNNEISNFKVLSLKNVTFRFPGRKTILKNISFQVNKGEIIALLGESGCGKSTTLQLIQKFYIPEDGILSVNGQNINSLYTPIWRSSIATVPQNIKIFNGTILYNIILSEDLNSINELTEFCINYGFDKYFQEFPQGYLTIVGEDGINISGGQKQLVAVCRALYKKPQLLLLDEATSSMDISMERFVLNMILKLRENMAVILVTHRKETAAIADKVYLIENGRIFNSPKNKVSFDTSH